MPSRAANVVPLLFILATGCLAYEPIARWGHATTIANNALLVHGGKSDPYNSYSYTSAPNINDLLFLPLNASFQASSPPWQLLNASSDVNTRSGPALAWHTLSAINDSSLLLFGGQPDPNSPTVLVDLPDSAFTLNLQPNDQLDWNAEPTSWANQPSRRIHHVAVVSPSGLLFIIGGEKADGSNNGYSDHYVFDSQSSAFEKLPAETGPPAIYGHGSAMLSDGRLLVFGGYAQSQGSLVPFSTIWEIDVGHGSLTWSPSSVSNETLPSPRRAFATTVLQNDNVLIHGGSDAALQENYADGWILNTSSNPMTWSEAKTLVQLGPRRDHFAISSGNQVLFGFGYGNSGPVPPSLAIYDVAADAFVTAYSSSSAATSPTQSLHGSGNTSPTIGGGIYPTGASGADTHHGSNGGYDSNHSDKRRSRVIVLSVTSTLLGIILVAASLFYARKWCLRHRMRGHFVSLSGNDDDLDRTRFIPAVVMVDHEPQDQHRQRSGILNTTHFSLLLSAVGKRKEKSAIRRNMLADEDSDVGDLYRLRHNPRGVERSSFSFKSFISEHLRSREPSITDASVGAHWQEKSDSFPEINVMRNGEVESPLGNVALSQHQQEQLSIIPLYQRYQDPFSDSMQENREGGPSYNKLPNDIRTTASVRVLPRLMSSPPISRPIPFSSSPTILSPLPEQASQTTLALYDSPMHSSHTVVERLDSPTQIPPSCITPPNLDDYMIAPFTTSMINANPGPMSRSDSWWKRFTHNSFLDRGISGASRKSPSTDVRESISHLIPIEEHAKPVALKTTTRKSVEIVNNEVESRSVSKIYEGTHEKSMSSLKTANTEGAEKIGRAVDVVQRVRTASHHSSISSTRTESVELLSSAMEANDQGDSRWLEEWATSPVQFDNPFSSPEDDQASYDERTRPLAPDSKSLGGLVAARVQAYERRLSQDQDAPKKPTKAEHSAAAVKYGLAPRQSLFIANPDERDR
ncbi:hypothetical protein AX17_002273 [Amanita inopinata Kibby_2008]|nr:hypothetical protein AX17_002273 [Amanita inopinata Kibby_2008]